MSFPLPPSGFPIEGPQQATSKKRDNHFVIPLSSRIVTPLTHTTNNLQEGFPRSKAKPRHDWPPGQQHQHHAAACFMLAAGAAISISLARLCLQYSKPPNPSYQPSFINPLLSDSEEGFCPHATQPCLYSTVYPSKTAPSRASPLPPWLRNF